MGTITEGNGFDSTINEIEAGDALVGGPGGNLNLAAQQLADLTEYLKGKTDGNHTITDANAPGGNTGTIDTILGWLANMIKQITGKSNWITAPATSLQAAADHINSTSNPHQTAQLIYYVGCVIKNTMTAANPSTYLGFGTWVPYGAGRVIVGVGTGFALGQAGGETNHTLTVDEMPMHTHGSQYDYRTPVSIDGIGAGSEIGGAGTLWSYPTTSAGGGQPHNNLQPYVAAYVWTRTA